jgi:ribosomal protein L23
LDTIEEKPEYIILDPPRDGIHPKALQKIIAYGVKHMVYISCKPTSLARDLEVLIAQGYQVDKVACVDMFPGTANVETVVCLSRKKVNDRINFDINIEALPDRVSKTATYAEIKAYVLEHYGFKVSSLYIAQIKDKHGIKERENYNIGEGKSKELICPPEKEEAITNALKHFNMI